MMIDSAPASSRRRFLQRSGIGLASLGLAGLMADNGLLAAPSAPDTRSFNPMFPKQPHFRPKAKRIIHIFLNGGCSHVDTFDPKPKLTEYHGKELPFHLRTERKTGSAFASPFKFKQYGQSGIPISELFADLGKHADDLCVIRSMHTDVPNHEPSLMLMNCGASLTPRPAMGSWLTYGLGTENQNLPGFIAICPNGLPTRGATNWQSSFLPGVFQGMHIDTKHSAINKLVENVRHPSLDLSAQRRQMDLLQTLNRRHLVAHQNESLMDARIQSFELAYRMQTAAAEAFDVNREPENIREAYGSSVQGRQLLIARRLAERGVRFVQVWHGGGQPWDNHDEIEKGHRELAGQCSRGIAQLLTDLKDRGLLEETLVLCTGEFGRTPTVELPGNNNAGKQNGRDHNHHGFSLWMAGGGVKGGTIYGSTDEFGFAAVENPVHVHDLHATLLHLLGFNHEKLTYRFSGRDFRLTDVHGHVVHDILA